jgi:hypothetical protein
VKVVAFVVLFGVASTAIGSANTNSEALLQLERAETSWRLASLQNYEYTVLSSGAFGGAIHKVSVRGELCKSKWRSTRHGRLQLWKSEDCDGHRIDEIQQQLRKLLEFGAERVEVRFNERYGYVEFLSITPGGDIPDQDWYVEMQRFVPR